MPWYAVAKPLPSSRLVHDTITTEANMDRASQVLAQGVPPGVPRSYRALADHGNVPHFTLYHRARGRRLDGREGLEPTIPHPVGGGCPH